MAERLRNLCVAGVAVVMIGALAVAASWHGGSHQPSTETSLRSVIADIAQRWPGVNQVPSSALADMIRSRDVAIFDVREQAEFDVSHLPAAVRVDLDMRPQEFRERYGRTLTGKAVVFYCSVGMRSTGFADRIMPYLGDLGIAGVHNLAGGIFNWHAEERPLVDKAGPTDSVHPYDERWGQLVARKVLTRIP